MQLQAWLNKALNGERQLVFVTGEPGIGKTTLVATAVAGSGSLPCKFPKITSLVRDSREP